MFNPATVLAAAFADHLVDGFRMVYGRRDPDHGSTIRAMAQLAVERISSSDALYHDVNHTVLVTLVGQTILRGRIMVEEVKPEDWLHFTVATLCHDIGYLRGICPGDRDGRYVIDAEGTHGRRPARRLGRVPGALPHRARQDLRAPPLPQPAAARPGTDRPGDRADPIPDSARRASMPRPAPRRRWSAPPT